MSSELPPKADVAQCSRHVLKLPEAVMNCCTTSIGMHGVTLHAAQAVAPPRANAPVLSEVNAKGNIVCLTSPRPFDTDNGAGDDDLPGR
jgi:hypothetical protein